MIAVQGAAGRSRVVRRERSAIERLYLDKVPAAAASAVVGYTVGGLPGALAGGTLPPILEHILGRGNDRYVEAAAATLEDAAAEAEVTDEEMTSWLDADTRNLSLATDVVRAALNTLNQQKLQALATVLAEGIRDADRLEMSAMYARALTAIEAPHIQVLELFASRPEPDSAVDRSDIIMEAEVERSFAHFADGLNPIMATLEREGLIIQRGISGGSAGGGGEGQPFSVTPFGRAAHRYLSDHARPDAAQSSAEAVLCSTL